MHVETLIAPRGRGAARRSEQILLHAVVAGVDVNLLQQTLLDLWLGDRTDLCVVGDDYQSIFSFTGASAEHLLGARTRFADATTVLLERNYRSTP
ncbi:ATP-dependent helicase, partial [bacterium]